MKFNKVLTSEIDENFNNSLEMSYISRESGGYIAKNHNIFDTIPLNSINKFILRNALFGTAIYKFGDFKDKVMVISGVHGNELSSQRASLLLFEYLLNFPLDTSVYLIPFVAPNSTMNNTRRFNSKDLNRSTYIKGSLTNCILNTIKDLKIDAVADFHTTALNSNPGIESIFCSKEPSLESIKIAEHIASETGSKTIINDKAGFPFKGAVEDESNLEGIPAITCEVVSPFGSIKKGSIERSFLQMKSFLSYF
ncbi:deacylase [Methanobrevibacter sp. DSM 116169]|uniref:deacylase n=1 Tax=Methanobrevibacter sp. DSM 116169 TaxID=3242727 RepID=UPI0038FD2FAB